MAQTKIPMDQIDGQLNAQDEDLLFKINDGGTIRTAIQIHGDSGLVTMPRQSYVLTTGSTQTIPNSTTTTIINPTVTEDTLGEYDNTTGKFTATESGLYVMSAVLRITDSITNAGRYIYLRKNSGNVLWCRQVFTQAALSGIWCSGTANAAAGDELYFNYLQQSGSNETINTSFFIVAKVG